MFLHLPIESVEIFPELVLSLSCVDLVALNQVICLSASIFTHWAIGLAAAQQDFKCFFYETGPRKRALEIHSPKWLAEK